MGGPANDYSVPWFWGSTQGISSLQVFLLMHNILDVNKFESCSTEEGSSQVTMNDHFDHSSQVTMNDHSEWLPEKIGFHSFCQRLVAKFLHRPFLPAAVSLQTNLLRLSSPPAVSAQSVICDLIFVANLTLYLWLSCENQNRESLLQWTILI